MALTKSQLEDVDRYVGKRLKHRRNELNVSQSRLADQCGITFQQVQKYERGVNRMGASRIYQMAQILDVSVSYFFGDLDNPTEGSEGLYSVGEDTSNAIVKALSHVNTEQQDAVLRLLRSMSRPEKAATS